MKFINILAFVFFVSLAQAQTPLIAHKSHAGSSASYLIASSSNFGQIRMDFDKTFPQPKLYKAEHFKPLNDSVIILEIKDIEQKVISTDTFPNKEKYSPIIFQARYDDSIRKKELEEAKRESEQQQQLKKQQQEPQQQLNESAPSRKKKKSYLLFLFGITGGGMLLMRLFSRSNISKPSIAPL